MTRLPVLPPDPEFAPGVDEPPAELDRRTLMKLLASGAALAGAGTIAGCMASPEERIMPRVRQPPELVPGVPVQYATAMVLDGFATGLVVTTYEARPTKVEGNPDHPASLGATTALHQASILDLYDPDRPTGALDAGVPMSREAFVRSLAQRARMPGLWFLMPPQSSPLVEDLIGRIRARHPSAQFAFHAPLERRQVYEAARQALGRPLETQYRFDQADVVVALDADFLGSMPSSVRWSRDFAKRRQLREPSDRPSRLYVAEPRPTPTGSLADHRLPARPTQIAVIARALLAAVEGRAFEASEGMRSWIASAAADLRAGRGLVIAGDRQTPEVHVLAHQIARAIGAPGNTVTYTKPALIDPLGPGLAELAAAIRGARVQTLVVVDANPVYTAPPELGMDALLRLVPETIHVAQMHDETTRVCRYFVPLSHYMESWGDARGYDGTIALVQPLIRPMHDSMSVPELLAAFAGDIEPDGHALVRARYPGDAWEHDLQRGVVPNTAFQPETASATTKPPADPLEVQVPGTLELAFDASPAVHDGRFAGNAWLQELPKPVDKSTWGNVAMMSPATAEAFGVRFEDVVRLGVGDRHVDLPVFVLPGHADGCISVELGYGRWAATPVAEGVGANVYPLRSPATPGYTARATLWRTGDRQRIAVTQQHFSEHGRDLAPRATIDAYRRDPAFTEHLWQENPTWLPELLHGTPQWAMTIDTMICSGCSACVIACQAENNIPVVGKEGVLRNREMHWLRIDTYRGERDGEVELVNQPLMCQHCEQAPCEYVCPVYATQHSPDGLNEMTYNRCIGTRFCSNNCPYKVRRFNWFHFTESIPKTTRLQYNPNVTVRGRGVMEKCTYCVQRIRAADIAARKQNRPIGPGEVVTACQQACPTGAIQFGQLQHADTPMMQTRALSRHYALLHDLGTRPRTAYLAKISNPRSGS